jgi:hypothetical protein
VVSTNGLEEGRFVQVLVEEVQRRQQQQQEVVEKEVSDHHRTFGESYSKGRHMPALRFLSGSGKCRPFVSPTLGAWSIHLQLCGALVRT